MTTVLKPSISPFVQFGSDSSAHLGVVPGPSDTMILTSPHKVEVLTTTSSTPMATFSRIPPTNSKVALKTLPFERFTSPALFHSPSNRFVALTDNLQITSWPATASSTLYHSFSEYLYSAKAVGQNIKVKKQNRKSSEDATKITVPKNDKCVSKLLVNDAIPHNAITLDKAGRPSLHLIPSSAASASPYTSLFPVACESHPSESLVDAFIIQTVHANPTLLVVARNLDKTYSLHTYKFSSTAVVSGDVTPAFTPYTDIIHASSYTLETPSTDATDADRIVSVSMNIQKNEIKLALFWSFGTFEIYSTSISFKSFQKLISMRVHSCFSPQDNPVSHYKTSFISSTHYAISGPLNTTMKLNSDDLPPINGGSNIPLTDDGTIVPGTLFFIAFELTYKTLSASTILPFNEPSLAHIVADNTVSSRPQKKRASNDQIAVYNMLNLASNLVVFCSPSGIHLSNMSLPTPTLLSVMGQAVVTTLFSYGGKSADGQHDPQTLVSSKACKSIGLLTPFASKTSKNSSTKDIVTTLIDKIGFERDFAIHLQNLWPNFVSSVDAYEREFLTKLLPELSPILVETPSSESNELKNLTSIEFVKTFYQGCVSGNTDHDFMQEPDAWTALCYSIVSKLKIDAKTFAGVHKYKDISLKKVFSPIFITIISRYCLTKLREATQNTSNNLTQVEKDLSIFYLLPLRVVIATNTVSARNVPGLLAELAHRKQWAMIEEAIVCVHDFAESDLIFLLGHALDCWAEDPNISFKKPAAYIEDNHKDNVKLQYIPDDLSKVYKAYKMDKPEYTHFHAKRLIQSILTAPVSKRFMEVDLKFLEITHALTMLRYLTAWFQYEWHSNTIPPKFDQLATKKRKNDASEDEEEQTSNKVQISNELIPIPVTENIPMIIKYIPATVSPVCRQQDPSFMTIIDWVCMILDSHFTQITLMMNADSSTSATVLSILTSLQDIVTTRHLGSSDEAISLLNIVQLWKEHAKLKQSKSNTTFAKNTSVDYTISIMDF